MSMFGQGYALAAVESLSLPRATWIRQQEVSRKLERFRVVRFAAASGRVPKESMAAAPRPPNSLLRSGPSHPRCPIVSPHSIRE
jgi:hypothetical protein